MRIKRRSGLTAAPAAILAAALVGCSSSNNPLRRLPALTPPTNAPIIAPAPVEQDVTAIQPVESGPGVAFFDPFTTGPVEKDALAFADGAVRWVGLMVAGHPELGRTPPPDAVSRIVPQLRYSPARVRPTDVSEFLTRLRLTSAVTATLSQQGEALRLQFAFVEEGEGRRQPAPIVLEGTPAEIRQQLPEAARQLGRALGLRPPRLPAAVTETTAELSDLGRLKPPIGRHMTPADYRRMKQLAPRSALAWMAAAEYEYQRRQTLSLSANELLATAPDNQIVWNQLAISLIGAERAKAIKPDPAVFSRLNALIGLHPNSSLLLQARASLQIADGDALNAPHAARAAVRRAPESADAWAMWGETIVVAAQELQAQSGAYDTADLYQRYRDAAAVLDRAIELDDRHARALLASSLAKAWLGESTPATDAYWAALRHDKLDADAYDLGISLFGPQWLNGPTSRRAVVSHAQAAGLEIPEQRVFVALSFHYAKFEQEAQTLLKSKHERDLFAQRVAEYAKELAEFEAANKE